MRPVEFLTSAQTILELHGEPNIRSAISRSYYAVYHEAIAAITRKGIPIYHGSSHTEVSASLKKVDTRLGILLGDYHKKRVMADYHLNENVGVDPKPIQ